MPVDCFRVDCVRGVLDQTILCSGVDMLAFAFACWATDIPIDAIEKKVQGVEFKWGVSYWIRGGLMSSAWSF